MVVMLHGVQEQHVLPGVHACHLRVCAAGCLFWCVPAYMAMLYSF
jgi:hypothetical protein